jgi:hypothetical protein
MKHFLLLFAFSFSQIIGNAQATPPAKPKTISVFLDCSNGGNCFKDYITTELSSILFVRDRTDADVHLLNNTTWNSNASQISKLEFIGRNEYAAIKDTIEYTIPGGSTDDQSRHILLDVIKKGLLPYIAKTELMQTLKIEYPTLDTTNKSVAVNTQLDKWNNWVFQLGFNGNADGNKNSSSAFINGYFSADRETQKDKSNIFINTNRQQQKYIDNGDVLKFQFQDYSFGAEYVRKLSEHIGLGAGSGINNSLFSNYRFKISFMPKFEYSITPYKEFNTRRITLFYETGGIFQQYYDTTLYLKTKELLFQQNLGAIASFTQPWGAVNLGTFWSNFFNDFAKNSLSFNGAISLKVAKGLNFAIWGNYTFVHDQINIRKGDISLDQLLTKNQELLSSYNYNLGIGLSYRFGSKNNSAVCPIFRGLNYSINL